MRLNKTIQTNKQETLITKT